MASGRLADVARKAGVSEATVSRVLNHKPGVSEATVASVLTALDVLGYERPTKLRGDRGRLVGLVIPELQNPIFPAFAEVVGGALAQMGFTPVLCVRTASGMSEAEYIEMLLGQHVSGIVFAGGLYSQRKAAHGHYDTLARRNLPVVLINAAVDGLPFPRVSCDDGVAMNQALGHLVSLGHRRIGLLLGPEDHVPSERKLHAARVWSRAAGITLDPDQVVRSAYSLESGHAACMELLSRGVTAVVAASDPLALGAVRAARRSGLQVPRDISIVGYDDSAFMNCTDPPLTTVRQPIEAMGRAAIGMLVEHIEGAVSAPSELLFEPELVVRASTAPVRQ